MEDWHKSKDTEPSHSNVQNRGNPFRTVDPQCFQKDSHNGYCPYKTAENIADSIVKRNETYRCIASGDHNKNHHMIYFAKSAVYFFCGVYRVINGTCRIEKDHCQYKYCKSSNVQSIFSPRCFYEKRSRSRCRKKYGLSLIHI